MSSGRLPAALGARRFSSHALETFLSRGQLAVDVGELCLFGHGRRLNHRGGIPVLVGLAPFRNVVEVRKELIELFLRKRIVLVVVTARAAEREAHEHSRCGLHPIDDVLDGVFLGNDAAFAVAAMVAIEPRRDLLVERRTREHVAGNLLQRELVERKIAIERVDDPIAPAPHVAFRVCLVSVRVRIARSVEPLCGHPLTIALRGEQAIDDLLVCVTRFVVHERIDFGRCRRQAGQVETDATNQGGPSASGAGARPSCSSLFNTKKSMSFRGHARLPMSGRGARRGGMKDQCFSHLAPCSIHR